MGRVLQLGQWARNNCDDLKKSKYTYKDKYESYDAGSVPVQLSDIYWKSS